MRDTMLEEPLPQCVNDPAHIHSHEQQNYYYTGLHLNRLTPLIPTQLSQTADIMVIQMEEPILPLYTMFKSFIYVGINYLSIGHG